MAWHLSWALFGLLLPLVQTPPTGQGAPETVPVPPKLIEDSPLLPPDIVTIIGDDLSKAINALKPGAVVLSAERYAELMERARKADAPNPAKIPLLLSVCRFSGQMESDAAGAEFLRMKITLEFRTQQPGASVPLGFRGLRFTSAKLDGDTPIWSSDAEGLALIVAEPKEHTLVLESVVPITASGVERRVSIERVPSAAITSLDLTTAGQAQRATLRGAGPLNVQPQPDDRTRLHSDALGVLSDFELSWHIVAPAAPGINPRVAVLGDLRLFIDVGMIHTEARLRIEARRGAISELAFRLPAAVSVLEVVQLERSEDARGNEVEWSVQKAEQTLTIRLRQPLTPTSAPVLLLVRWRQPPTGAEGRATLGRIELARPESAGETGVIGVWPGPGVRVQFQHELLPVSAQDLTTVEQRSATHAFRYWQQPVKLEATLEAIAAAPPVTEARVNHTLRQAGAALHLVSDFEVAPKAGTAIQELEVRWPAGFSLDRRIVLTNLVESLEETDGLVRLRLANRQQDRFTLKLEGILPLPIVGQAAINPPHLVRALVERGGKPMPAQVIHRAGEVTLAAGDREWWLREGTQGLRRDGHKPAELEAPLRGTSVFQLEAASPAQIVLGWQPQRAEIESRARAFITRQDLQVEQTLICQSATPPATQLWLRVPRGLEKRLQLRFSYLGRDGVRVFADGRLSERQRPGDGELIERAVLLPPDTPGQLEILIEYLAPRAEFEAMGVLSIPLVAAGFEEMSDRGSVVRLWAGGGVRPAIAAGSLWQASVENTPNERGSPPTLVLRSSSQATPLSVRAEVENPDELQVQAERCLVEVRHLLEGKLAYRLSIRMAQVRGQQLELALPAAGRNLSLQSARLFGRELAIESLERVPHPERSGFTLIRIPVEPRMLADHGLLEVHFRVHAPALLWLGTNLSLRAPILEHADGMGLVRWCVEPPPDRLTLAYGGASRAEQPWRWLLWLRAPQPEHQGAELHAWLTGGVASIRGDEPRTLSYAQQGELTALHILHISRQLWLLVCSLGVLLVGLLLHVYHPRWSAWAILATLVALILLCLHEPTLVLALLYGAQPGFVVLAAALGILWLWQRRWRRQVAFMPGFRRIPAGSSLLRPTSPRPPRQPSTVDSPVLPAAPGEPRP